MRESEPAENSHSNNRTPPTPRVGCLGNRPLWKKAVFTILTTVAFLVVTEIGFRMTGVNAVYHQPRIDRVHSDPHCSLENAMFRSVPHSTVRSIYDSNPRGYFERGNYIDHRHNSIGWRDVEHTSTKPIGTRRILGLGDSYLWGQGVKREDICLTKLERLLNESESGLMIETLNAGKSAMNTQAQRSLLRKRGMSFDPDLVIVHFVLNDVEYGTDGPNIDFLTDYTQIYFRPDFLSKYSYLWGWVRQRFLINVTARNYVRDCVATFHGDSRKWEQCRRALKDIQRLCAEHHLGLLVVIFPFFHEMNGDYPFQVIHDVVRQFCHSEKISVLDLRDSYRMYSGPELWVHPTDQHPNEIAHDIAARAIATYLDRHPDIYTPGQRSQRSSIYKRH